MVFSGWPNMSYSTFGGKIVAIEKPFLQTEKFRVLTPDEKKMLSQNKSASVQIAQTLALLDNVPIWFELWRT
jgi:hypothetical protein